MITEKWNQFSEIGGDKMGECINCGRKSCTKGINELCILCGAVGTDQELLDFVSRHPEVAFRIFQLGAIQGTKLSAMGLRFFSDLYLRGSEQ